MILKKASFLNTNGGDCIAPVASLGEAQASANAFSVC